MVLCPAEGGLQAAQCLCSWPCGEGPWDRAAGPNPEGSRVGDHCRWSAACEAPGVPAVGQVWPWAAGLVPGLLPSLPLPSPARAASAGNAVLGLGPPASWQCFCPTPLSAPGAPAEGAVPSVDLAPCWAACQSWRNVLSLRLGEQPGASPAPGLMVSSSKSPQIF